MWLWFIWNNGINHLNGLINGMSALLIITSSLIFLYTQYMKSNPTNSKWKITISFSFLFYFLISSGIYSFTEFFLQLDKKENWIFFAVIHTIANVGLNFILAIGLYQCSKQSLTV